MFRYVGVCLGGAGTGSGRSYSYVHRIRRTDCDRSSARLTTRWRSASWRNPHLTFSFLTVVLLIQSPSHRVHDPSTRSGYLLCVLVANLLLVSASDDDDDKYAVRRPDYDDVWRAFNRQEAVRSPITANSIEIEWCITFRIAQCRVGKW